MSTLKIADGAVLPYVAGGTVSSGDVVILGTADEGCCGVILKDGVSGDVVPLALEGVFQLAKASGTTFAQGAEVWWDDSTDLVVAAAGLGNQPLGIAWQAGVNGVTTCQVRLCPSGGRT